MSYTQLTLQERYVIYHLKLFRLSHREIGRRLNRHHTTISREIERNGPLYPNGVYWHEAAQAWALERRRQPRHRRKQSNQRLVSYVESHLAKDWSPEAIAGRLKKDHPHDDQMQVSTETVYRWVYRDAGQGGRLYTYLCWRHKKRRTQRRYGTGRGLIPGRVSIAERPAVVAERRRFGDWEGDTVEGAKGSGSLTSHVERKSRYLLAAKLENKTAEATMRATVRVFQRIPRALRKTLTIDNGKEFSRFTTIEQATGLDIYFADPYAAWQRGCNENTNGLLRRYFPKGTDFRTITEERLASIVKKLNHRPRKCLGYQTPQEVFQIAKRGALGM
jgi:IS30 family transposase